MGNELNISPRCARGSTATAGGSLVPRQHPEAVRAQAASLQCLGST